MVVAFFASFILLVTLFALSWPLGGHMLYAIEGPQSKSWLSRLCAPLERGFDKVLSRIGSFEMTYKEYIGAVLAFHLVALLFLYLVLRLQQPLVSFLFAEEAPVISSSLALNMAVSFLTNTDWQCVSPDLILHPFSKVVCLVPVMFLSPAVGLSVLFALLRGLAVEKGAVGNFFKDMVRSLVYVLFPMAAVGALVLAILGTGHGFQFWGDTVTQQPIAWYESIKMIGTNGGGYFTGNSMNMQENPTTWTTLFQWGCMLLLPMAAFRFFGEKLGNKKYALRVGLLFCFLMACMTAWMEYSESSTGSFWFLDQSSAALNGKSVRIGSFFSSLWTVTTTSTSCGATVSDLADLQPLSKIIPLFFMHTGETIFGGAGVGAISLIFMQIVAMFSAGLLVGRSPELLGKKIDSGAMKLSLLAVMLPVFLVYISLWFQISFWGHDLPSQSETSLTSLIYSMTSTAVNNGSSLTGIDFSSTTLSFVHSFLMLTGRILTLLFALLLGEHCTKQRIHPRSEGSLHVESWTSLLWLFFVIVSSSLLCFCSLWIIGPFIEAYTHR